MTRRYDRRTNAIRDARRVLLSVAALLGLVTSVAQAQAPAAGDAGRGHLSRAELQQLLTSYEEMATSSGYSGSIRDQARREAVMIKQRLTEGDMREGDRIMLVVEGHDALSDTFNVVSGRRIILPELGDVALAGVLRAELENHLRTYIGRRIRDPIVHARSLVRVEIRGAVAQPGFYTLPSDVVLTDALMMAGGPTDEAESEELFIARGDDVIWDGHKLREAVMSGQTLDQLSIRTGDVIELPEGRSRLETVLQVLGVVGSLTGLVMLLGGGPGN